MSLRAVKILGINITNSPKKQILKEIQKYLHKDPTSYLLHPQSTPRSVKIVTPNPEQINYAQKNTHFRELLNRADVAIPDGIGVVWASRLIGQTVSEEKGMGIVSTIPGIDFMEDLVSVAATEGITIALIGGRAGLAVEAFDCLSIKHPGLRGWAVDGPEARIVGQKLQIADAADYFRALAQKITQQNTRIVFVGLGAPKQEYFVEVLTSYLVNLKSPVIFMSVGGSFDELSGRIARAPGWVGNAGFKWLWRLILEPWRIRRQLVLVRFVWLVLRERLLQK